MEQLTYEARGAFEQYDKVDPRRRLRIRLRSRVVGLCADPVPGHRSLPWPGNLAADGKAAVGDAIGDGYADLALAGQLQRDHTGGVWQVPGSAEQ